MAIPASGIDEAREAARLGWVTRKQAEKAIRIAWARASNGQQFNINAMGILGEQGLLGDEANAALEVGRSKPAAWWKFWKVRTQGDPLRIQVQKMRKNDPSPDMIPDLFHLSPENFTRNLNQAFPGTPYQPPVDIAPYGVDRIAGHVEKDDLRLNGWRLSVDKPVIFLEQDARPRWSLSFHVVPSGARLRIEETRHNEPSREIRVFHGEEHYISLHHQAEGVDPVSRYAGVVRVLRATVEAAGATLTES